MFVKSERGTDVQVFTFYENESAARIWGVKFQWTRPRSAYGPGGPVTTVLKNVSGDPQMIERWNVLNDKSWGYRGTIRSSYGNWTLR